MCTKKRIKNQLLRHSKKRRRIKNSKYNIYKNYTPYSCIFLENIFFPFYNDYELLSDIDKINLKYLSQYDNSISCNLRNFLHKYSIDITNYKKIIQSKNISSYSKILDQKMRKKVTQWCSNLEIKNILFDLEIFNTNCMKTLLELTTNYMNDVERATISIFYNIIAKNNNFIDKSSFEKLVITCFILACKIILSYDNSLNDSKDYIKDITNEINILITKKDIVYLEAEILKKEDWIPCYKVQKRLGLIPF
jgi:hypothetical protein